MIKLFYLILFNFITPQTINNVFRALILFPVWIDQFQLAKEESHRL